MFSSVLVLAVVLAVVLATSVLIFSQRAYGQSRLPAPFVDTGLPVLGRQLTAAEIVERCVSKLTDMDFRNNPYLSTLVNNLTSQPTNIQVAVSTCMKILTHGRLVRRTEGGMEVSLDGRGVEPVGVFWPESERSQHNEVALKVLRTMTSFHQTYFQSKQFVTAYYHPSLGDSTEPAYFLSWALFGRENNQVNAFRDVLRKTTGIKAIRRSRLPSIFFPGSSILLDFREDICWWGPARYVCGNALITTVARNVPVGLYVFDFDGEVKVNDIITGLPVGGYRKLNLDGRDLVAQGTLWGLGEHRTLPMVSRYRVGQETVETVLENFHASAGGGVLGTSTYTGMNYQLKDMTMDGGRKVPRKWSANVMRDFLCVDSLPNLRPEQVVNLVNTSSTYEFRRAASCVACHAQVDPLAFTVRNMAPVVMGYSYGHLFGPLTLLNQPVTQPAETGPVEGGSDNLFASRPPNGALFFNNWRNVAVRVQVQGLAQLGQAMSEQDDFYLCAAKRYYRFFTGVEVNLRGVEANMKPFEREHYRNVVKAGLEVLKTTQSTERMIEFIFSTPAFHYSDFRAEVKIK
jgi:hypothetical protein